MKRDFTQSTALRIELDKVIRHFATEWDVSVAEVLGVLDLIWFDIIHTRAHTEMGDESWKEQ